MIPEQRRKIICEKMGFKDPDFLKWHDGMFEAEEFLIACQREADNGMNNPHYGVWSRYVGILQELTKTRYGGDIHASVEERQVAFLRSTGVPL